MPLLQQELFPLALEAAVEEVGGELEEVGGLFLEDLAVEGVACVEIVGRKLCARGGRHGPAADEPAIGSGEELAGEVKWDAAAVMRSCVRRVELMSSV